MIDEPTWKKRGCGTSILTWLGVLAAVAIASLPAWVNLV